MQDCLKDHQSYKLRAVIITVRVWQDNNKTIFYIGAHSSIVVKALCYQPEGRRFDTRWGDFLNLPNPSGRTSLLSL
jgi:hypothetical protein